jgi:single-stranded-DNA-specific exonuclease
MKKLWDIMPKAPEEFVKDTSYNEITVQLLFNRGIVKKEEIELFFQEDYDRAMYDPFLFRDMAAAVELIIKHIKEQNQIVIYGDYDADGVTSSAVLYETLTTLKAKARVYIPDRVSEGYGLRKDAIDEIIKMGAKLIVTVDCGIRDAEQIEYAKSLGLEVLVTDHHMPPEEKKLPEALVINPATAGETYVFKYLAGVGVAFKFSQAIISKTNLASELKERLEERLLDLVAIGTVTDCVSILGENRFLVRKGLEVLTATKRLGLKELIKSAQINDRKLDSWNIGFQIGPRLNAAGRMDHANTAFELLISKDQEESIKIAQELNDKNQGRQKITEEITAEVEKQVNREEYLITGICPNNVENESWKEGVIGLVAGRICEKYYRPTLVITHSQGGYKGSGRSIEEFNLIAAISECAEFLDKFGGHPMACGFSLSENNLENFLNKMRKITEEKIKNSDLRPKLKIEAELKLADATEDFLDTLQKFAPFGQNNDRPKFLSHNLIIIDIIKMGLNGQHLKLKLMDNSSGAIKIMNAIGFNIAETWSDLKNNETIDIVYYLDLNEFNGKSEMQLKIIDIRRTTEDP